MSWFAGVEEFSLGNEMSVIEINANAVKGNHVCIRFEPRKAYYYEENKSS